jgi:ABC-type amino acid transport substrate-binding protein
LAGAVLLTSLCFAWAGSASADAFDRIRHDKAILLAYREDAPPFSYKNSNGAPAGFMVDLCDAVVKKLTQQPQLPALSVIYVSVTAVNRFEAIERNKADLLCEPTSATLTRRALVDFSIYTYIDGASLMILLNGPQDLQGMSGQKIGCSAARQLKRRYATRSRMPKSPPMSSLPKPMPKGSGCWRQSPFGLFCGPG